MVGLRGLSEEEEVCEADRRRIVEGIRWMKIGGVVRMSRGGEGRGVGFRLGDGEGERQEGERGERRESPEVILGDSASSYVVDGNGDREGNEEDEDESYRPPEEEEEEEEEDTPRGRRAGSRGHTHGAEAEAPAERSKWSEVPSLQMDRSSQQESIERADEIRMPSVPPQGITPANLLIGRHTDAYKAMTANAVPLIPPPSEQPSMQTPSRKRTRPFEIAASDDSSSFDPISPQRYANSTPRRSAKRMRSSTPLSGSRRTSAPGRLFASPRKAGSLSDFENLKLSQSNGKCSATSGFGGPERIQFKEEKRRDTSDAGVYEIVRDLRDKYPDSSFETDHGNIKCLDCDKSLKATFHGLVTHERSKAHQNNIKEKRANPVFKQAAFKDAMMFPPPKAMDLGIDFSISQQPLAVYAQKAAQNLASTREQYLKALENENQTGSIRMSFLESRQEKADKLNMAKIERLKEGLDAVGEKVKTLEHDVTEKVEGSEDKTRIQLLEVQERIDMAEGKNEEQLKSMESRIKETSEYCNVELEKMLTSLAKSDHRNVDRIDDLKTDLRKLDEGMEEQLCALKAKIIDLEGLNTESQREDLEASIRELESSDLKSRNLRAKMEARLNDIENSIRESDKLCLSLVAQIVDLQTSQEQSKAATSHLHSRIEELEKANAQKEEEVHDLEANLQMLSEDLQRQREGNLQYQKTIKDQIEAHFQFTEKRERNAEEAAAERKEEARERERVLEERLMGAFERRLERVERENREEREVDRRKIIKLKERNKELQDELDDLKGDLLPLIMADLEGGLESVVGLKEKVEMLEGLAVRMGVPLESKTRAVSERREEISVQ